MPDRNKVALVTGGARRIGRAIVEDLAAHGFAVAIHCNRSRAEADALAASIRTAGGRATVVVADLCDRDAAGRVVAEAAAALGTVRLLVNNASVFRDDSAQNPDWAAWEAHFSLHLKTPALLIRDMAAALPDGADGLVVNMIDQRVWRLGPRFFSYTLSKAALWTMTETMAQALAPKMRVNAIGPGPTLPNERQLQADFDAQIAGLIMKKGPKLAEFGATIRYFWETPSLTGQMIAIDGGQHLAWETPDVTGMLE
jgi:NAD(P)-dependent dehydrogenase (short-subunit alcohol dehydrogenase family)